MKKRILFPNIRPKASKAELKQDQRMTRPLIFSIIETEFNITFATSVVSRFAKKPSQQHTETLKTILWHLKETKTVEITYSGNEKRDLIIRGYFDSNWAGDYITRKSTFGYIFMLNKGPVS